MINGYPPPPPPPPSSIPDAIKAEITKIWSTVYAIGIDKFLETNWFSSRGQIYLLANQRLCDQFASLIHRFTFDPRDPHYPHYLAATYSLEAQVVWSMINLCRQATNPVKAEGGTKPDLPDEDVKGGVHDAVKRLEIFEALVTGEYLTSESAPESPSSCPKPNGTVLEEQLSTRTLEFWKYIYTFLTIRNDEAAAAKEIDDTISSCRTLLDSRENRDVIYSIMIARHIGAKVADFPHNLQPATSNDEQEDTTKLNVAKRFIEDEAAGKGTNQVVQRLCGMAARSWGQRR